MRFIVSDHGYTRAWSRCLFKLGVNIPNKTALAKRFEEAVKAAEFFELNHKHRGYRVRDKWLWYAFFPVQDALILATVYPTRSKV